MISNQEKEVEFQERRSNASTSIQLDQQITIGVPIHQNNYNDLAIQEMPDKQILMKNIVQVYVYQYLLQFVFLIIFQMFSYLLNRNYETGFYFQTSESFLIMNLIVIIAVPILVFNIKILQQPQYKFIIYGYSISYALFVNCPAYFKMNWSNMVLLYIIILSFYNAVMGLFLLSGLYVLLLKVQQFQFKYFYLLGGIVAAGIFLHSFRYEDAILSMIIPFTVMAYTMYFSFALKVVVMRNKFKLNEDQSVFGALAVYCVMMAPCVAQEA